MKLIKNTSHLDDAELRQRLRIVAKASGVDTKGTMVEVVPTRQQRGCTGRCNYYDFYRPTTGKTRRRTKKFKPCNGVIVVRVPRGYDGHEIEFVFAHELHHLERWQMDRHGYKNGWEDVEALADGFAKTICEDIGIDATSFIRKRL